MAPEAQLPFYGPYGAINPSGDLIVETRAWREQMFEQRAPQRTSPYPPWMQKVGNLVNQGIMPGMMGGGGGQLALNQLLVVMDGIDNPPFMRRFTTNKINSFLTRSTSCRGGSDASASACRRRVRSERRSTSSARPTFPWKTSTRR